MPGLQKKVIAKTLSNRVKWWTYSIKNPACLKEVLGLSTDDVDKLKDEDKRLIKDFQESIYTSVIVTGGCIASMLLGEDVNDVDIYFSDKAIAEKVAKYYVLTMIENGKLSENYKVSQIAVKPNQEGGIEIFIKSQGVTGVDVKSTTEYQYFEGSDGNAVERFFSEYLKSGVKVKTEDQKKHDVSFMSSNAISLQNGIQLIFRFIGDINEIHKNFDFVHCTNFWTQKEGVTYKIEALQALLEKRLVYQGSLFPVAALFRLRKFISRGYRISAGEITKISYDISKLNLDDINVLKQQLMGCDVAYFHEVLNILQSEKRENIDRTYLISIIDRVFNDHDIEADNNDGG